MNKKNSLYKTVNKITAAIGVASISVHYAAQHLIHKGIIEYNFIGGNLGDFGATLAMTAWYNKKKDSKDVKGQLFNAIFNASAWTVFELLQKNDLWIGTYDPKDILAYWAGSTTAFLLGRLASSNKVKKSLEDKTNYN